MANKVKVPKIFIENNEVVKIENLKMVNIKFEDGTISNAKVLLPIDGRFDSIRFNKSE